MNPRTIAARTLATIWCVAFPSSLYCIAAYGVADAIMFFVAANALGLIATMIEPEI